MNNDWKIVLKLRNKSLRKVKRTSSRLRFSLCVTHRVITKTHDLLWTGGLSNTRSFHGYSVFCSYKVRHFQTCDTLFLLAEAKNPSDPDGNLFLPISYVLPKTTPAICLRFCVLPSTLVAPNVVNFLCFFPLWGACAKLKTPNPAVHPC